MVAAAIAAVSDRNIDLWNEYLALTVSSSALLHPPSGPIAIRRTSLVTFIAD